MQVIFYTLQELFARAFASFFGAVMLKDGMPTLPHDIHATIDQWLAPYGLQVRGRALALSHNEGRESLFLIGSAGDGFFQHFQKSPEYKDGAPDPLDRWSRRLIDALCHDLQAHDAKAIYPFDDPAPPFQQWALQSDTVSRSPMGILIHNRYGLWHAYRGAIKLSGKIVSEAETTSAKTASPCDSCAEKPCLSACPVKAFSRDSYDVKACRDHLATPASQACFTAACLARRACPVAQEFAYAPQTADFFMRSFQKTLNRIL